MRNLIVKLKTYFKPNPDNAKFALVPSKHNKLVNSICLENGQEYEDRVIYEFNIIDEDGRRWKLNSWTNCVLIYTIKPKYVKLNIWSFEKFKYSGGLVGYYRWTKI